MRTPKLLVTEELLKDTNTKVLDGSNNQIKAKIELLRVVKKTLNALFKLICIDTLQEM